MPSKKVENKTPNKEIKMKKESPVVKESGLNLSVFGLDGAKKGTVALPKEVFGAKINEPLMAQAVRVYLVNQRQGTQSTKTRGEVRGSTRKIYRQKGTGRARHGAITAPIFVGGGIAFGPRPRNFELKLSKNMKKKALFSALTTKAKADRVYVVDFADLSGKTKQVYSLFKTLKMLKKTNLDKVLLITEKDGARASRNIAGLKTEPVNVINTYGILNSNYVVFEKNALLKIETVFLGK